MNRNHRRFWVILSLAIVLLLIYLTINDSLRRVRQSEVEFCVNKSGINILLQKKYSNKIKKRHPNLNIENIEKTIKEGAKIETRKKGKEHWIFYKRIGDRILKVPVMLKINTGIVKSAYFVPKENEEIAEKFLIESK